MRADAGHLHLAAGERARDQEGAGLDAIAQHRVLGRVHLFDAVDLHRRAAGALDVGAHADEELAEVDDLGLTRHVLEGRRAFGHDGRHEQVLGRPHAGIVEEHVDRLQPVGPDLHEAVVGAHGRAHLGESPQVDVDLARAEVAAARHGHAGLPEAGDQRAHDLDRRAHALHQLVRRHLRLHAAGVDRHGAVGELHDRPEILQHLLHGADVLDVGDVVKHARTRRE